MAGDDPKPDGIDILVEHPITHLSEYFSLSRIPSVTTAIALQRQLCNTFRLIHASPLRLAREFTADDEKRDPSQPVGRAAVGVELTTPLRDRGHYSLRWAYPVHLIQPMKLTGKDQQGTVTARLVGYATLDSDEQNSLSLNLVLTCMVVNRRMVEIEFTITLPSHLSVSDASPQQVVQTTTISNTRGITFNPELDISFLAPPTARIPFSYNNVTADTYTQANWSCATDQDHGPNDFTWTLSYADSKPTDAQYSLTVPLQLITAMTEDSRKAIASGQTVDIGVRCSVVATRGYFSEKITTPIDRGTLSLPVQQVTPQRRVMYSVVGTDALYEFSS